LFCVSFLPILPQTPNKATVFPKVFTFKGSS
jgi:hypothetical protein